MQLGSKLLPVQSLTEGMTGVEFVKFPFTTKYTSATSTNPYLILKQACRT